VRGHVRWRGQSIEVRVHPARGRTVTRTVKWKGSRRDTERAADRALTKLLAELDDGGHQGGPDGTLRELAEAWWEHRRPGWSPSTAAGYRARLDGRILPHLGDVTLRKVTPKMLADWQVHHAGTSPASAYKSWMVLGQVLTHGQRLGWLYRNPAADLRGPSVPPSQVHAPSAEAVQAALSELARCNPDLHVFAHLAAATGARRGEVCGIRWSDLDGPTVTLRRSVVLDEDGRVHVRPYPKGKRPRTVTLDDRTLDLLAEHRKRHLENAAAWEVASDDGFVFSTEPDGKRPWRPTRVTQAWGRVRDRLGLHDVRFHDLRHFAATRLLDAGFAAADVAARLGHANPAITHRLYAHAIPARDAEMAATMGKLLG
jgi:integrase